MIVARRPLRITGRICRKSPPSSIHFPPKGLSQCIMSLSVLSRASRHNLCTIGASSQIISLVIRSSPASCEVWEIVHVESSLISIGIANLECAVLPFGKSVAAIPLEATVITISPLALIDEARVFHRKVLPVPPYPCTKKSHLLHCPPHSSLGGIFYPDQTCLRAHPALPSYVFLHSNCETALSLTGCSCQC